MPLPDADEECKRFLPPRVVRKANGVDVNVLCEHQNVVENANHLYVQFLPSRTLLIFLLLNNSCKKQCHGNGSIFQNLLTAQSCRLTFVTPCFFGLLGPAHSKDKKRSSFKPNRKVTSESLCIGERSTWLFLLLVDIQKN